MLLLDVDYISQYESLLNKNRGTSVLNPGAEFLRIAFDRLF